MRLTIRHQSTYRFADPAAAVIQTLRLSPRSHDGQHVVRWRLDVDRNCRLRSGEDAFGNLTHVFAAEGPVDEITVLVEGEIDTQDSNGVVLGSVERFPPALYLRETPLTALDSEVAAFAEEATSGAGEATLDRLHALLIALNERMTLEPDLVEPVAPATDAFRRESGVAHDLTHVFLAGARRLGVPARFVCGYLRPDEDLRTARSGHSWAEAYVEKLGWVGFDPANGLCSTDAHVRVAVGLDYLGAAPVRGSRYGGLGETLQVDVVVEDALATASRRRF